MEQHEKRSADDTSSAQVVKIGRCKITRIIKGEQFSPLTPTKLPAEITLVAGQDWRIIQEGRQTDPDKPDDPGIAVVQVRRKDPKTKAWLTAVTFREYFEITERTTAAMTAVVDRYVLFCDHCNQASSIESIADPDNPVTCPKCGALVFVEMADIDVNHT